MVRIGAYIIGDEILSGKRQDKHLSALIDILNARGLKLSWATYLGDIPEQIEAALRASFATDDIVFSFGGIGSTPDDHTRRCAAQAAGVPLHIHPEGRKIVEARFGDDAYPHRIRMVDIPETATLIPNPVNQMPGFKVAHHHFVPGFPSMAWPMCEWVLDEYYRDEFGAREYEFLFIALAREGDMVSEMQAFVERYPELGFSSLPSFGDDTRPAHVEFGIKGEYAYAQAATTEFRQMLQNAGISLESIRER